MDNKIDASLIGKEFFYYVCGSLLRKGKFIRYDGNCGLMESGIYGGIYDKIPLNKLIPVDPNEPFIEHDESKEPLKMTEKVWPWFFVGWFVGDIIIKLTGLL